MSDSGGRERGLERLNSLDEERAAALLRAVCGSAHWVRELVGRRPFGSVAELEAEAERAADALTRDDWLEAFAAHPRIGDRAVLAERLAAARANEVASPGWEGGEQGGVDVADDELLDRLEAGNRAYEQKFGFIFLVNATGKTGAQLLAALEQRLGNDREDEWRAAATQQRQITQLRLHKLLDEQAGAKARR